MSNSLKPKELFGSVRQKSKEASEIDEIGNGFLFGSEIEERRQEAMELFEQLDSNGDGKLSIDEMRDVIIKLGITLEENQLRACFDHVDTDGNGYIDAQECLAFMEKFDEKDANDLLKEVFGFLDDDNDGFISKEELAKHFRTFDNFTDAEIDEMLNLADSDNDGKISFDELARFMQYADE